MWSVSRSSVIRKSRSRRSQRTSVSTLALLINGCVSLVSTAGSGLVWPALITKNYVNYVNGTGSSSKRTRSSVAQPQCHPCCSSGRPGVRAPLPCRRGPACRRIDVRPDGVAHLP